MAGVYLAILVYVVTLLALLAGGVWIAFALGMVGMIGLYVYSGGSPFAIIGFVGWNTINSFVLIAVPLFIFMGEIIFRSGLSMRLYRALWAWLHRLPGGLLQSNILACTIFAAISGSSVATAATIGTVAIPEMKRRGYDLKMIFGSLAAGGTLGILIPPSIAFIIYGAMVQESVADLFIAGVVPGLMLSGIFMAYIALRVAFQPHLAPTVQEQVTWRARLLAIRDSIPVLALMALVLGGIYTGVATPTEAAALGATGAIIVSLVYRELNLQALRESAMGTVRTTCMLLFIIVGAQIMSFSLVNANIPRQLTGWLASLNISDLMLLILIYLLYTVLGMFIDGLSMMLLTLPIIYPVVLHLGLNPIWFGVVLVILIELGLITPPVGLNLYVIHGISGGRPISEVIIGSLPYTFLMLLGLALLTAFPDLALWLPAQMAQR